MESVLYPNVACMDVIGLMRTKLAGCSVHLFTNDILVSPGLTEEMLTEADFGGYAPITATALLPAYLDPVGGASAQIATVQFNCDGTEPENTVFGFYVTTTGTPGVLYLVGRFAEAIGMSQAGDAIPLDIKFNFGANQI